VIDQFLSLQYGKTLNGQEKRQARPGRVKTIIQEIGNHDFVRRAQMTKRREGQFEAVARIMYWEHVGRIVDTSSDALDRFYIQSANDTEEDWKLIKQRATRILNTLARSFPGHYQRMRESITFMLLYWLVRHIFENYVFDETTSARMPQWFNGFSQDLDDRHEIYGKWSSGTTAGRKNEQRFGLMLSHFLSYFPGLEAKDAQRLFTDEQRRIIWQRADGKCQWNETDVSLCNFPIEYDNFDADHVLPHNQGGRTSVDNGRVLCIYRNRSRHADGVCQLKLQNTYK